MKPHRRLPKAKREGIIHAQGVKPANLARRIAKVKRPDNAVTAGEFERDVLAFIGVHYAHRHLDVEVAQLALGNIGHQLIMAHLRAVAAGVQ